MASGALAKRKECPAAALPTLDDNDEVWDIWAFYVAQLCMSLVLIASPEHISIGTNVLLLFVRLKSFCFQVVVC